VVRRSGPGSILGHVNQAWCNYDIGDCSALLLAPALGRKQAIRAAVRFDPQLCDAILQGYAAAAGSFLTPTTTTISIAGDSPDPLLELGLRFFSDYLAGNTTSRTRYPRHNSGFVPLDFSFRLTASIESRKTASGSINWTSAMRAGEHRSLHPF